MGRRDNEVRRVLVTGSLLLLLAAAPAIAADQTIHLPVKAPQAASVPEWSGFYVGADIGYALANENDAFDPAFGPLFGFTSTNIFGASGISGGVLGGYNLMVAPRWLAGVEGDWSGQDIKSSLVSNVVGTEASIAAKQTWAASLRGRVGYLATPGTLVYGTAGWAWSRLGLTINLAGVLTASAASAISGPQIGIGMETVIAANWRARLEYLHTFYNSGSFDSATFGISGIKPSVGLGRFALVYQFGPATHASVSWPAATIVSNWTGFYVGGSIGGAVATGKLTVPNAFDVDGVGLAGPLPSVLVGYNYQFAPRWLVGVEAELAPSVRSTDFKLGWLGAARARLGYLMTPNTMIFGTAGWVGTALDDIIYSGVVVLPAQRINGMEVGGGIEAALNDAWSARFDYQYAIMKTMTVTLPTPATPTASVEPRGQSGRIALVRRFSSN
jgi:outer membrane immunogenic protein